MQATCLARSQMHLHPNCSTFQTFLVAQTLIARIRNAGSIISSSRQQCTLDDNEKTTVFLPLPLDRIA
jgi:hypothetical protein